jgi:hypothetical protein
MTLSRRLTRWLQVQNSRSSTIGGRTLTTTFPNTCTFTISFKNNRAKSKKIAAEVCMVRAETEEIVVEQQEAGTTALTGPQNIKNKANVVLAKEKSEELNVQRQKLKTTTLETDNTNTENTHAQSKKIDVKTKNKPDKRVADSKSKKIAVTVFI